MFAVPMMIFCLYFNLMLWKNRMQMDTRVKQMFRFQEINSHPATEYLKYVSKEFNAAWIYDKIAFLIYLGLLPASISGLHVRPGSLCHVKPVCHHHQWHLAHLAAALG